MDWYKTLEFIELHYKFLHTFGAQGGGGDLAVNGSFTYFDGGFDIAMIPPTQ